MRTLLACLLLLAAPLSSLDALEDPPRPSAPAHRQTDDEIQTAIVKGIVANPEVFAAKLRVQVVGGRVTLRGTVQNRSASRMAERVARAVPGVRSVKNRLTIERPSGRQTVR